MLKTSIPVLLLVFPLAFTATSSSGGKTVFSTVFKRTAEKESDGGFQPSSSEFARILSVSYKGAPANESIASEETHSTSVRKFDSGSLEPGNLEIIAEETPPSSVIHLLSTKRLKGSNVAAASVTTKFENENSNNAAERSTKGSRVHYSASNSHPYAQQRDHHPEEDHGHVYFPEAINEVSSPHYDHPRNHHHEHSPHHHHVQQQNQYPQYYLHHVPKHVDEHHEHLTTGLHKYEDSGLTDAVTKSLKFFIPTALLLTGASVLFPNRVKIPTNPQDDLRNRPKRSAPQYSFSDGRDTQAERFEKILPGGLRREHRTQSTSNEGVDVSQHPESEVYDGSFGNPVTSSSSTVRKITRTRASQSSEFHGRMRNKNREESDSLETAESQYDAFKYQKDAANVDASVGLEDTSLKSITAVTPTRSYPLIKTSARPDAHDGRKGRKIRVLLRARKNGTSDISSSGNEPRPSSAESKPKVDNKQGHKTKLFSAQLTQTIETINADAENSNSSPTTTIPTSISTSPDGKIQHRTPTDSKKSLNDFRTHLSQREPELLQILSESVLSNPTVIPNIFSSNIDSNLPLKHYDLSPDGPVVGLLSSVVEHQHQSEVCQKRALCELGIRGVNPTATRFETFMWTLATLVPDAFTTFYDLEDTFAAIRDKQCSRFACSNPNLDIQELPTRTN